RGRCGVLARGGALGALAAVMIVYLGYSADQYAQKTVWVGNGADSFYCDESGESVRHIVAALHELPAGASVAVVPQGAMLNYLARRRNSIPYIVLMPPEVLHFGQSRILASLDQSPPDFVLLLQSDPSE